MHCFKFKTTSFKVSFQTELGQALDLMTAPPHKVDLDRFTMERWGDEGVHKCEWNWTKERIRDFRAGVSRNVKLQAGVIAMVGAEDHNTRHNINLKTKFYLLVHGHWLIYSIFSTGTKPLWDIRRHSTLFTSLWLQPCTWWVLDLFAYVFVYVSLNNSICGLYFIEYRQELRMRLNTIMLKQFCLRWESSFRYRYEFKGKYIKCFVSSDI